MSGTASELIPPRPTLASLREAAAGCRACDLSILRALDEETRRLEMKGFVRDLVQVAGAL